MKISAGKSPIPAIVLPRKAEKFISSFNELSSWQYGLLCGGAAIGVQSRIESKNKNVDETTRKFATYRTTVKLTFGTVCGVITRFIAEKVGHNWLKNQIKEETLMRGTKTAVDNWFKTKELQQFKNIYLSPDGDLYRKKPLAASSKWRVRKYDFGKFKPDNTLLRQSLVKNIDLVKKLPKAFGNVLATAVTIATALTLEPPMTDKILNIFTEKRGF